VQQRVCRLQALLGRDLGAVHARGAGLADGFGSTQAFVRRRLRMDARPAAKQVRAATRVQELPDTAVACAAGEISQEHVTAVCQANYADREAI
jgi:hypothetical protein